MKFLDKFIHTDERLEKQLKALESRDPATLPLLVITDQEVRLDSHVDGRQRTIDYATRQRNLYPYCRTLVLNHCNEVVVMLQKRNWLPKNAPKGMKPTTIEVPVLRGLQFWHNDGKHYVYWGWLDTNWCHDPQFSVMLREQLARQGLYRKTVDEWRIDIRAGRMGWENLMSPTQF